MPHRRRQRILEYIGKVLLLATLVFALGKPAMELAAFDSYASIIWPPAGVAVAMLLAYGVRLWPGIFIGSFLINTFLLDAAWHGTSLLEFSLFPGMALAAGSSLQAVVACYLVKRVMGMPLQISRVSDAVRLAVLVGPIASLVAATIATPALDVAGKIPPGDFFYTWRIWWGGDALGAIIFMPITLAVIETLPRVSALRRAPRVFPLVALACLVIPLVLTLVAWRQLSLHATEKAQANFERIVQENERAFQYRLDSYEQAALGGVGLFAGSSTVSRTEWRHFAEAIHVTERFPGLRGISYIERVNPSQLKQFLADRRAEGMAYFNIHPEGGSDLYYILKYIEPEAGNTRALGMNIATDPSRLVTAHLAAKTGAAAVTPRILLVQDEGKTPGFAMLYPIYASGQAVSTPEERNAALRGWVSVPFNSDKFMKGLTAAQGMEFDLKVYDADTPDAERLIYASNDAGRNGSFSVSRVLDVKQHHWLFVWDSTAAFERHSASSEAAIILVSGLILTGLFGMLLTVLGKRAEDVERMVDSRTAELREREANLAQVIDKLTQSNAELERFAYIVSHDMQEPIRAVANFSSLLWHQYEGKLDASGKKYLSIITDSAKRLQAMVSDLLEYARVGQGARAQERMDIDQLMKYVIDNLKVTIEEHDAHVTYGEMPVLQGYPVQFMSLLQNLINNGIKYQPAGNIPRVHVSAVDRGDHYLFSVRDNGIGIDPENAEKIFEPFRRLHTFQEYHGTGLGLAAAKKIVNNHGGRIWVDSSPGYGATFFFTVMK